MATRTLRLTKKAVDGLAPRQKAFIIFDADVKGFGCRVAPTGTKSFILEYRPGAGGRAVAKKRLTLGRYGAMTVDQARTAALDALARIRLGKDPQAEKIGMRQAATVADLIDAFTAEHVDAKLKRTTAEGYKIALEKLRAAHGSVKAAQLARGQIAAMHARMVDNPYAANRFAAIVSKLFSWSVDRGFLPEGHSNPAAKVGRYREQGREQFLTGEELGRLGDALRLAETDGVPWDTDGASKHLAKEENRRTALDPFSVAAVRLLVLTGARLREILRAQWRQIDFERGLLNLTDSKTGRKSIYLSAAALEVLSGLPRFAGNPHIIPGAKEGQPRSDLKKPWLALTRAADLEGLRVHDLRHSFASVGAGASLGLPVIGKLLGHAQAATTARYAHLDADPVRRAAEVIGTEISAAMAGRKPGAEVVPPLRSRK